MFAVDALLAVKVVVVVFAVAVRVVTVGVGSLVLPLLLLQCFAVLVLVADLAAFADVVDNVKVTFVVVVVVVAIFVALVVVVVVVVAVVVFIVRVRLGQSQSRSRSAGHRLDDRNVVLTSFPVWSRERLQATAVPAGRPWALASYRSRHRRLGWAWMVATGRGLWSRSRASIHYLHAICGARPSNRRCVVEKGLGPGRAPKRTLSGCVAECVQNR